MCDTIFRFDNIWGGGGVLKYVIKSKKAGDILIFLFQFAQNKSLNKF